TCLFLPGSHCQTCRHSNGTACCPIGSCRPHLTRATLTPVRTRLPSVNGKRCMLRIRDSFWSTGTDPVLRCFRCRRARKCEKDGSKALKSYSLGPKSHL